MHFPRFLILYIRESRLYSASCDPHGGSHGPLNSAYHMNLRQARFSLSSAFAAKLEAQYNYKAG